MTRCPKCGYPHNHAHQAQCQRCKEPLPKRGRGAIHSVAKGLILLHVLWFFQVDAYETWYVPWGPTPHIERSIGGWTHDGPYKTKRECRAGRDKLSREPYRSDTHSLRYDPGPCFSNTYEEYITRTVLPRRAN